MRRDSTVLDTLRAVAVLLVLGAHIVEVLASHGIVPSTEPWPWHIGRLGVLLFFVHTSLVLMMSLERTRLDGAALLTDFYVRRAFRIYPLAIVTVLGVSAAGVPPVPWQAPVEVTPRLLTANLLLVQNLADVPSVLTPLWSLPLEIQMYLVLPLLFMAIDGGRRTSVATAFWLVGGVAGLWVPMNGAYIAAFIPCFMSGVLAFCLARRGTGTLPFWIFGIVLTLAIVSYVGLSTLDPWTHSKLAAWGVTLALGLLLPRFRDSSSAHLRRTVSWIAKYSYGIYLSHMISLWLVFLLLPDQPLLVQLCMLGAMLTVIPVALYHTIEAPGIRIGTACAAWLRRSPAMPGRAASRPPV